MRGLFTGLVSGISPALAITPMAGGRRILLASPWEEPPALGDSVAVSGVCLTVVRREGERFEVEVGPETLGRTTLGRLRPGMRVNLELALRLADRLGGHLVAGHVDGLATLHRRRPEGSFVYLTFGASSPLLRYVVSQGSVAVDGVSLTVARREGERFVVQVIPETLERTTLGERRIGDVLNLEVDLLARYVEQLLQKPRG